MRRVVTGRDQAGKSIFVSEGPVPRGVAMRGVPRFRIDEVWRLAGIPDLPADRDDPTLAPHPFFPDPGGTEFCVVTFPAASDLADAAESGVDLGAAEREFYAQFPRMADSMESGAPGMHTTRTIDYGVVLSGEIWLELDDGAKAHLKAGDCVIQNGTRHAWRNLSDRECVMAFVIVGARTR
ncbi:MAG TPA: cupin domain-containing protein [Candidatus Binatia bacterium]|nr:cupin domain-containing protein [Candidatus Binatia bacterium]